MSLSTSATSVRFAKFAFPVQIVEPWKTSSNSVLMVLEAQFLFPKPRRTSNIFVCNFSFLTFEHMPICGYLARKCLFLGHEIFSYSEIPISFFKSETPDWRPYYEEIATKPPSGGRLGLPKMSMPHTTTTNRTDCFQIR